MTPWAEATESIVFYYNCIGLSQIATEDNRAKQASVYKAMAGKKSRVHTTFAPRFQRLCTLSLELTVTVAEFGDKLSPFPAIGDYSRQCGQGLKRR